MTAHLAPIEAYRRDLARRAGAGSLGDDDAGLLLLAHVVRGLAGSGRTPGGASAGDGAAELHPRAAELPAIDDARVAELTAAAGRMESAGALLLAATTLSSLASIVDDSRALLRGRILAQWARVERVLGEADVAADLYMDVGRLGRRAHVPELSARADLGLGVLARMRGNYPEARRRFRRALAAAERAGLAELTGLAHQSLLVAAAVARDFDTALAHGWQALAHTAGEPAKEAEVLVNLATLCLDAGENAAAMRGFTAAAERASLERFRSAAHAGAAVAAARLGDRESLARYAALVERALAAGLGPYESAQRLLTLSDAWRAAGEMEAAESTRRRGLAIARARGFAELVHEYGVGTPAADPTARPVGRPSPADDDVVTLGAGARRVVRALAAFGGAPPSVEMGRARIGPRGEGAG
jgi:tetratricopeptide (TPR) repeat protein